MMARTRMRSVAVALAITFLLTSCSSSDPVAQQESTPAQPTCSNTEADQGSAWIKGQLDAFTNEDPESAYSFASESFKAGSNLEQFIAIIVSNYGFLLSTSSYTIGDCTKQDELFLFDVEVTDIAEQKYSMKYTLSKIAGNWGVDAASVTVSEDEPLYS